jgi:oxalate decarboxylase/phosphoglucose isomerase-like protein (cupin superfamily)
MKQTAKSLIPYYEKVDIKGTEHYRTYVFPGKEEVTIQNPEFLIVSDNGHRVFAKDGISHYIPYGWIHLYWKNIGDRTFKCEEKSND